MVLFRQLTAAAAEGAVRGRGFLNRGVGLVLRGTGRE